MNIFYQPSYLVEENKPISPANFRSRPPINLASHFFIWVVSFFTNKNILSMGKKLATNQRGQIQNNLRKKFLNKVIFLVWCSDDFFSVPPPWVPRRVVDSSRAAWKIFRRFWYRRGCLERNFGAVGRLWTERREKFHQKLNGTWPTDLTK